MSLLSLCIIMPLFSESCFRADSCDQEITGRSHLSVRPQFQSMSPEYVAGFRDDRLHERFDGIRGAFQIILLGGKSVKDKDLARYFFPFGKTELIVDERINSDIKKDLLAQNFNIYTINGNFRSRIQIRPSQTAVGLGFHYRQSIYRNDDKDKGLWVSISTPLMRIKNEMIFCESVINDGGGPDFDADVNVEQNMTQAFMQREWCFGKISCKALVETKLADIELKGGVEWLHREPCHLESYWGFVVPTGTKVTASFLFEPVVGNGHHFGIIFGNSGGIQIWHDEVNEQSLRMEFANNSQTLFSNTQCRSFDVVNKPWSRYMPVYKNMAQAEFAADLPTELPPLNGFGANFATPGINVFTQQVHVKPGFIQNVNTAFVYTKKKFQCEAGYNYYCRRAECITLACPWKEGPAFKHILGLGNTNPVRNITGNFILETVNPVPLQDYQQSIITEEQLDLQSAATPCLLSHTIYGALGWRWDDQNYPTFFNAGASYEMSNSNNAVLSRYTLWAKFGMSI